MQLLLRISVAVFCFVCLTVSVWAQSAFELNWSEDGGRCVYALNGEFFLIDVEARKKEPVCNENDLAGVGRIDDVSFGESANEFFLRSGSDYFRFDRAKGTTERVDELGSIEFPSRLSLPRMRSLDSSVQTALLVENGTEEPFEMVWVDQRLQTHEYGLVQPNETFSQQTYVGHAWLLKSKTGKELGSFRARNNETLIVDSKMIKDVRKTSRRSRPRNMNWKSPSRSKKSPDRKWVTSVRKHNLWINENQLTDDATEQQTFLNVGNGTKWIDQPEGVDVRWSPDSQYVVAFQTWSPKEPRVRFIESSPKDQLQPLMRSYSYPKPGDWLPQKTLRLFSVEGQQEIDVSNELFENPWSLRFVRWTDDGKKFWLHYNQRGHQAVRLIEVEVATGKSKVLIEEASDTFVHYSDGGKSVFERLPDAKILWASERSGWNHLYRYDARTGDLSNAVTSGEWNVKRIDHIDRENGVVWFNAVGVFEDQDPYHEHFCRVNLDGTGFKVLTDGDGTHRIQAEQNRKYFVDTFSRVDLAPVTQLRDSETGELVAELEEQDTVTLFGERPLTTRFNAKGRDGVTDIWGIIHWPRDFDPQTTYPVVEGIYAGPHDHHVPKSFRSNYYFPHQIADAGMIVVQIDGMGTAWRSKKFHDVCYKNLKDGGFPDRIAWIKAAAMKYPQMDISRVGICGGSAGGQNAMAALLWHNDFYKVAVADCGCHDNRMDKVWWNEQWMGWPVDASYVANSNMENAHLLTGHLMLTVGEMDRNVDPATTTQVVKKLIEHDKDFEFVLIPGAGHGAGDTPWAAKKRLKFLQQHLLDANAD